VGLSTSIIKCPECRNSEAKRVKEVVRYHYRMNTKMVRVCVMDAGDKNSLSVGSSMYTEENLLTKHHQALAAGAEMG